MGKKRKLKKAPLNNNLQEEIDPLDGPSSSLSVTIALLAITAIVIIIFVIACLTTCK